MIELVTAITNTFAMACAGSAFGCKILSTATAYAPDSKLVRCWQGRGTVFCLQNENLTIAGLIVDEEETAEFVDAISPHTVLCSAKNAVALKLIPLTCGQILSKKQTVVVNRGLEPMFFEHSKTVFSLLQEREMADNYEGFLLDFTHKLRHGMGAAALRWKEDCLVACALSANVTGDSAVITAVATAKGYERQGLATLALTNCEAQLSGRTLYVFKENNKNDAFYGSLGYSFMENWAVCNRA